MDEQTTFPALDLPERFTLRVVMTGKDVTDGDVASAVLCPLALALRRALAETFPGHALASYTPMVHARGDACIHASMDSNLCTYMASFTEATRKFIHAFDVTAERSSQVEPLAGFDWEFVRTDA